jgi:hypothetical protein
MKNREGRMAALEGANGDSGMILHLPQDGDSHSAEWERLLAARKRVVAIVRCEGLNNEAVEGFKAAEPGRSSGLVVTINKPEGCGGAA